jgi:hypothetical protein
MQTFALMAAVALPGDALCRCWVRALAALAVKDWLQNHAPPQSHLMAGERTNQRGCVSMAEVPEPIIIWSVGPGAAITGQTRRPLCVEKIPGLGADLLSEIEHHTHCLISADFSSLR